MKEFGLKNPLDVFPRNIAIFFIENALASK